MEAILTPPNYLPTPTPPTDPAKLIQLVSTPTHLPTPTNAPTHPTTHPPTAPPA